MDKFIDKFFAETFNTVPDIFNVESLPKSNEKSQKYRNDGNSDFINRNYFNALINYNKSIAFAETKDIASFGYGNRSAVYFELKLYDECLKNIQLALKYGFPEEKMQKLIDREENCKEAMAKQTNIGRDKFWNTFKLSYPANEKIPFVVDCVELRKTDQFGRGIYAKKDLKAGDIICVEEPTFTYPDNDNVYIRCYNCFKGNSMNLIPCDQTASMMFCSDACKQELSGKALNMIDILSADVKMLSDIAKLCNSLNGFENLFDHSLFNKTIFDFDLNNPKDPEYKHKLFMCLLSLSTNDHRVDHVCKIRKYLGDKASDHILSIFNLNFQKANVNDGQKKFIGGYCIPLFASLINHSCVRNVHPIMVDNKLVTIVLEPIKAGEQLFFCYSDSGAIRSKMTKEVLEKTHKFKCSCQICINGHESHFESAENVIKDVIKSICSKDNNYGHYGRAKKSLKHFFEGLNGENNKNSPRINDYSVGSFLVTQILEIIAYQCSYPFFISK